MALTPDVILGRAEEITGERIGRSTLNRWVREELVTEPERRSLGRGRGGYAEFPPQALAEVVAAWYLLRIKRRRVEDVREGRKQAFRFKTQSSGDMGLNGLEWLEITTRIEQGIPFDTPVGIRLVRDKDGNMTFRLSPLDEGNSAE